jgi:hypothetical protein
MVDNQGTDTPKSANEMFDESVFTDTPQEGSVQDNTLTPADAFSEPSGEEAPQEAPSQETPQPIESKNDDTRYQYWQSQAAKRDNELRQAQAQLHQMQQQVQAVTAQQQEQPQEQFPEAPAKPERPRNFNRQEAYEDSSSESARYLDEVEEWRDNMDEYNQLKNQYDNALVQEQLQAQQEQQVRAQRAKEAQMQQARQLQGVHKMVQEKYGMSAEEGQHFIKSMSDPKSITVDNLVQLYRLQNGTGQAAPQQGQPAEPSPAFQQTQRAQQVPQPMGVQPTAGNTQQPAEDAIMDNMISDFKSKNPW